MLFICSNYLSEGFLHLQNLVGMSIIERIYNTTTNTTEPFEDIPVNTKVCTKEIPNLTCTLLYYFLAISVSSL